MEPSAKGTEEKREGEGDSINHNLVPEEGIQCSRLLGEAVDKKGRGRKGGRGSLAPRPCPTSTIRGGTNARG